MKCAVVIPVGPNHEAYLDACVTSVKKAWECGRGPFTKLEFVIMRDPQGAHGRSAMRNEGMASVTTDWYFLLDADDLMMRGAFQMLAPEVDATFGAVWIERKVTPGNRWPVTRDDLFKYGADGTLSMGCFVRGNLGLQFDEALDVGEDFDFYLRLPSFVKRFDPLVAIGYRRSAGGPRSSAGTRWREACWDVVQRYARAEGRG